jgi:small conductance mechanosensitive channel
MSFTDTFDWDAGAWWEEHGWAIIWTVVIALAASFLIKRLIRHAIQPAVGRQLAGHTDEEIERRTATLSGVISTTANIIILLVAVMTILPELGIDARALLAGVGVTSLAISLGAQSIVRDALSGLFVLAEDQYGIGDTVTVANVTGTVEDLTLRRTVIRDVDGILHSVPNGTITTSSNHTRNFARVRVSMPVAHASDVERVRIAADRAGQELAADPAYKDMIITPPRFLRIESMDMMGGVQVNVNGRVVPGKQWEVAGALRSRLIQEFAKEGIKPWASQ